MADMHQLSQLADDLHRQRQARQQPRTETIPDERQRR
jgi:hypothetical protein